jgi:hypothetical protein
MNKKIIDIVFRELANNYFCNSIYYKNLMNKFKIIFLGILQLFISLGAITGGLVLIISPDGSIMQLPAVLLDGTPFPNFLIPGLILFTINGLGHLLAGILCFRKSKLAGWSGIFFGFGLMIWIFIQVSLIGGGDPLQYTYFFLGLLESLLGIWIISNKS